MVGKAGEGGTCRREFLRGGSTLGLTFMFMFTFVPAPAVEMMVAKEEAEGAVLGVEVAVGSGTAVLAHAFALRSASC